MTYFKSSGFTKNVLPHTGTLWIPSQGNYKRMGTATHKFEILNALKASLKEFLIDYMESNIE